MELSEYQAKAKESDQRPDDDGQGLLIPLLGLAGETGSLLSEYKKRARDGAAHQTFIDCIKEELGDVLWYLSTLATKADLSLDEIAQENLAKVRGRWIDVSTSPRFFDGAFPPAEQLPREFDIEFKYDNKADNSKVILLSPGGSQVGNLLSDNSYIEDGYRFHDAYHFAFAAMLAWSPVTRRNLKRKRKSDPMVDEVEDGGRGWVIEEAIAALAFAYASEHGFLEDTEVVDQSLLRAVRALTRTAEVRVRSAKEWERAIVTGSRLFHLLRTNDGGRLHGDLLSRTIRYTEPS